MKTVFTPQAPEAIGPYSQGVIVNNILYTSGQIPLTKEGNMVDGDVVAQTHQVFRNVKAILHEAGASLEDVIKVMVFIQDMNQFADINSIYGEYFSEHKPARSCVEVAKLPKGALVEIEVIAKASA